MSRSRRFPALLATAWLAGPAALQEGRPTGSEVEPGEAGELEAELETEPRAAPVPPLLVPEGFVAEVVIAAPELRWPSAVHCLDDGTLLVAEDPMDMVGPADQPIDRILRLVFRPKRVRSTVFADGLYAVFGIQSLGEVVLVVNMPHLTRLVDADQDGVAEQREVLVRGLGPEPPGMEGGFNDHVVSGIGLGPDGWLYLSVGDKGIPLATGSDGSTVSLRGGGVVRLRPDGSRLELVASGTRNHLDVVVDERGDLFTYDNTDDGLGWWTRLTHIVEEGYYGYPFDYREHPERMLPCMADYGGGAPTGGLHYGEAAWPLRYRGSYFWGEWGKGTIRRFDLEREGATFAVDLAEDFATAPEGLEFRPVDLCLSPDGRFMYVADWGHPGWQSDEVTGRVWRIRREDDDPGETRDWGGLGEVPRTVGGWIDELGSDSRRLRERAQRELERLATVPIRDGLIELLATNPVERRRRHALWTLVRIGGDPVRVAIERALSYPNEDTRIQALRALRRRGRSLPDRVLEMVVDDVPHVRREAATTAGWLGNAETALQLVRALPREEDPWVRWAIGRALRRIGAWDRRVLSWLNFTAAPSAAARVAGVVPGDDLLQALYGLYDLEAVERLAWLAGGAGDDWSPGWAERLAPMRARALTVLAAVHRRPEPWDGRWWSTQPAKGPPPPLTVDWEGTPRVLEAVRFALRDPAPEVRRAGLEALVTTADLAAAPQVRARYLEEPELALRLRALEVLAELGDEGAVELLVRIVRDRDTPPEEKDAAVEAASRIATPSMQSFLLDVAREDALRVETLVGVLEALGAIGAPETATALLEERLAHPAAELRAAALRGLAALEGARAGDAVLAALDDGALVVRRQAVVLAGELGLERAVEPLLALRADVGVRPEVYRALARLADPAALDAFLEGLGAAETREASRRGLRLVREAVREELEARHRAGRLREPLLGEVRAAYLEPLPLLDWQLAGPCPRGSGAPVFDGASFQGRLDGAGGGAELASPDWRPHRAAPQDGFVDLDELLSTDTNVEAWARGRFTLARTGPVELVLGSDDSMTAWIDGREVHDFAGARAWGPDQDRVPLELEAGSHEVLLRIGQGVGDWAFSFATLDPASGLLFQDAGLASDPSSLQAYREYALRGVGNVTSGFRLFQDTRRLACVRCHRISTASGSIGERVGPVLDGIGQRYDRAELIESILAPSSRIASGYTAERVWTRDGRNLEGQVLSEDRNTLVLVDASGERHVLSAGEVEGRSPMRASIMPDGYHNLMTRQELADLVTFLQSLGGGGEDPERASGER